jgi:hypothetical protein
MRFILFIRILLDERTQWLSGKVMIQLKNKVHGFAARRTGKLLKSLIEFMP